MYLCCIVKLPHSNNHITTKTAMRILSCFFRLNNYISYFLSRSPPVFVMLLYLSLISGGYFMDYLKRYQKMISLRGLTDHTMKSYQTLFLLISIISGIPFTKRLHRSLTKISGGFLRSFKRNGIFLIVRSMLPFPNCFFSLFTFFISPGMTHSFLCGNLIPICHLSLQKKKPKSLSLP